MSLPRDDKLRRTLRVRKNPQQSSGIVKQHVGAFIGRETPGESESQCIEIENLASLRDFQIGSALYRDLARIADPYAFNQALPRLVAHPPKRRVANVPHAGFRFLKVSVPAALSTCFFPKTMGFGCVLGKQVRVDAVGHVMNRHLVRRPAGKQRLEETAAHGAMQPVDTPFTAPHPRSARYAMLNSSCVIAAVSSP